MTNIYNKANKVLKWGLLLCLMVLMPLQAHADYGIIGDNTWQQQYLTKIANGELKARNTSLDESFEKIIYNHFYHYLIKDVWDLCRLADIVNGGYEGNEDGINVQQNYFLLDADIDLEGAVWYPIGVREAACFAGYFDGNGHTIQHLSLTVGDIAFDPHYLRSRQYGYGLFGYMKGVICNLKMTDAQITINQTEYNSESIFNIGLLCGYAGCIKESLINGASGVIWGCDITGAINGKVDSNMHYYYQNCIGGLAGLIASPVSIYQSHTKVDFQITNCGNVGGIVGYIENGIGSGGYEGNTTTSPKVTYLFDCTADVSMSLSSSQGLKCGGICGYNDGCNIVACASSGRIFCPAPSEGSYIGGIVGENTQTLMNCVSLTSIQTAYTAGGIVGWNSFTYNSRISATIANCVYSGYLYSGENSHGIVGRLDNSGVKPVNCLFLGTLRNSNPNEPLWSGSANGTNSYCDQNLYDDGCVGDEYHSFSDMISGDKTKTPLLNNTTVYIDWKARWYETETSVSYPAGSEWQYKEGFYPRIQVESTNITNSTSGDLDNMRDCLIDRAVYFMMGAIDDAAIAAVHTPKLFPAYAWLASVPAGIHNGLLVHHLDDALSLAAKEQDMETIGDETKVNIAHFSLPTEQTLLTVSGETATPKENVQGGVVLTVTSSDKISKQFYLNINTLRKWDQEMARTYDSGNGTSGNPYIIHNARQLMRALRTNEAGQYYKLKKDIWFNENLITESGGISESGAAWNATVSWKAHLDGDHHSIRGLYAFPAASLLNEIADNASLENVAFTDCAVKTPETGEAFGGFLGSSIGDHAVIRNCLFDGLYQHVGTSYVSMGALFNLCYGNPTIEDCVVSVATVDIKPYFGLIHASNVVPTIRRVLVLNNNQTMNGLTRGENANIDCYFPAGYLLMDNTTYTKDAKSVEEMTDGTFFSGEGYDKWTAKKGRFPMLTSFAGTAFGKLISLPIYTQADNGLNSINRLLDFTPSNATWTTTTDDVVIDQDIRVLEPKTPSQSLLLVRSMDGARMVTPLTTATTIKTGIEFKDVETKKFCLAHYDSNGDNEISLDELKSVTLSQLEQDMNEDDGNPHDNDGASITTFPEFRYFAGVTDLGTSFQDKDKLQTLEFSGKITELSDDDFKGNTSMTEFTVPTGITSVSGTAFYNSGLENYSVETDHNTFAVTDGLLFNKNQDQLVSIPNGRKDASITIPDNVRSIASNAVYKMTELENVYIDTPDYDYETVIQLNPNAFTAADGKEITYYVEDATQDYAAPDDEEEEEDPEAAPLRLARRTDSKDKPVATDGKGKGHLVSKYQESDFWKDKKIEPFYKLQISEKSKDADGNYWSTMYIGFDTQLPEDLTPYTVQMKNGDSKTTLVLKKIKNRKVPMLTPVVILAKKPGDYHLLSSNEPKYKGLPMSENILEGVDRNGKLVNQFDSNEGGCLTLGRNKSGKIGFFIYKGTEKIPAFRAFITVNTIGEARNLLLETDDETTNIQEIEGLKNRGDETIYDLKGQRREQPVRGLNITNGRLFIKK